MRFRAFPLVLAALLLAGAGCLERPAPPRPVAPAPAPTKAPTPAPVPAAAAPEAPPHGCLLTATGDITIYVRASLQSEVFTTFAPGDAVVLGGGTADGWVGFDPAAMQAPNVGPFRLRWIAPGAPYKLSGECDSLPAFAPIPPDVCYVMFHLDTPMRAAPAATATATATLRDGDYAAAVGRSAKSSDAWIKIDAARGSLAGAAKGWVAPGSFDFNGPCEKLPVTTK